MASTQKQTTRKKKPAAPATVAPGWIDAGDGYALTLRDGKLVCRNPKGQELASVPRGVKEGDAAEELGALREWLEQHARECVEAVETWMLRSLPVPRAVVEAVWDDPAWRRPLENTVVTPVAHGKIAADGAGLLRGVDPKRGVGVVDLDGETRWLRAEQIAVPHPILLAELDGYRDLVTSLGLSQGIAQLHRETWVKPEGLTATASTVDHLAGGKFAMLMHAMGKTRALGYRVRGGYAACAVWEQGELVEARYWIGAEQPDAETYTGELMWVDAQEHRKPLSEVGAVAYSEGLRMATAIYAARVVEKEDAS
jgi:hypothetical protein